MKKTQLRSEVETSFQEGGQHHQQERDAVHRHEVVDAVIGEPLCVLDELVAGLGGVEEREEAQREQEGGGARAQPHQAPDRSGQAATRGQQRHARQQRQEGDPGEQALVEAHAQVTR